MSQSSNQLKHICIAPYVANESEAYDRRGVMNQEEADVANEFIQEISFNGEVPRIQHRID